MKGGWATTAEDLDEFPSSQEQKLEATLGTASGTLGSSPDVLLTGIML